MKRLLLLAIIMVTAFSLQSQNKMEDKAMEQKFAPIEFTNHIPVPPATPLAPSINYRGGGSNLIPIGSAANIYSILLEGQNQVIYNADLNTVAFFHRKNEANNNGVIQYDVSTDGGVTWSVNQGPLTDSIEIGLAPTSGARYPSGTIYNPSGNTNPNNAYAVSIGPALGLGANTWGYMYVSSEKLDGTNSNDGYWNIAPSGQEYYFPYGVTTTPQGNIWFMVPHINNIATIDTGAMGSYGTYYIYKGTFNSATNSFNYSLVKTIIPDSYHLNDANFMFSGWNMAFSPNGNTGYAVIFGAEKGGFDTVPKPIIYKSIDAGVTWNKLPEYNFSAEPLLSAHLLDVNTGGYVRPYWADNDITVDNTGKLHIFTNMLSQARTHPDSVNYIWLNNPANSSYTDHLILSSTSDGVNWNFTYIDSVANTDGDMTGVGIDARPQISRSVDGTRLFVVYSESDPNFVGDYQNNFPDVIGRGVDISQSTYVVTDEFNFTIDHAQYAHQAYFPTVSPVSIGSGTSWADFEIPIVFAVPPSLDPLLPVNFVYIDNARVAEITTGVEQPISNNFGVYPNPGKGIINVDLGNVSGATRISVLDMSGRLLKVVPVTSSYLTIDLSAYPSGIYLIRAEGNDMNISQKVILSK